MMMMMMMMRRWICFFQLVLLLLLLHFNNGAAQSVIKTLPGYPGVLPVHLETGYIGVGENDEVQLFYYFVESEGSPRKDPLILWFNGGPGCSSLTGLVYEIGPITFDFENFDGSLPSIILNPYAWTKLASIIFVDWPAGTGFSYSNTTRGYLSSDTKSAKDNYTFLRKWLLQHPKFIKNRVYVAGDSYAGKLVPMVAWEISQGNEAGLQPRIALQGYITGNGLTNEKDDVNEQIPYAHRLALISDEYFEAAKSSCNGEYTNTDPKNLKCLAALAPINKCIDGIYMDHILEPKCKVTVAEPARSRRGRRLIFEEDYSDDQLLLPFVGGGPWCRSQNYITSYVWANDLTVQKALSVRKGTITQWTRYNKSLAYDSDMESVVHYHKLLSEKPYEALIYSGDHDMKINYMATLKWIRSLNLTVDEDWRPWNINGQVAGYTEKYTYKDSFHLTFVTVKGAGHTAPEYKPRDCLAMLDRWFSLYPI